MRIITSKLLVLLAAEVNADTFTAKSLAKDTVLLFDKKFTEDDIPTLVQTVRSFVVSGFIEPIGFIKDESNELLVKRTRSQTLYCFTKKGKKARKDASIALSQVLEVISSIVADDLKLKVERKLKLVKSA